MEESWILIDKDTGLHVRWYFWLRVLDELNRSGRYGAPFALLLLEAEADASAGQHGLGAAAARVPAAIRSTDVGGVLGDGKAAVLLLEQDIDGAEQAAERVLRRLAEAAPRTRWTHRLLCYPRDGGEISSLLTEGTVRAAG